MARYSSLKIYKATFSLVKEISKLVIHFPKQYRYSYGQDMLEISRDMLLRIYDTNTTSQPEGRLHYLQEFLRDYEYLKITLDLMIELRVLSPAKLKNVFSIIGDVGANANKWFKYTKNPGSFVKNMKKE